MTGKIRQEVLLPLTLLTTIEKCFLEICPDLVHKILNSQQGEIETFGVCSNHPPSSMPEFHHDCPFYEERL